MDNHEFVRRIPDVIFANRTGNAMHPTEKPVDLLRQIIQANVCGSVFDPFMGSGSTLVAAKELGKTAVGVEIDERYCETAASRCVQRRLARLVPRNITSPSVARGGFWRCVWRCGSNP